MADHAANARQHIDWAHDTQAQEGTTDRSVTDLALLAVAEATLALVEQQRVANLIALSDGERRLSGLAVDQVYTALHTGDRDAMHLAPDIGALLGIPAPATRPLARPKWSPRSFNSGEEEGSIYCPACNWTTSGHESPCDNAWFEHATEAHPERPIQ